ncbi:MAG: S-layer homology domain-containing protein [Bacillota bacterium]
MGNKRSVRLIAVLLILVMFLGVCPTALLAQALSDVGEHWAKEAINLWTARGIVKGYEDGTFGPDRFITRAEFAALLNRTFGFTTVSPKEFPDVSDTAWYAEEVAKAAGAGYMEGYEDGSFRPDNNITRQEAALVFARIYNLEQIDESYDFSDFDSIPDWSRKAVVAVAKAGLMQGYPDGSFGPARNITRAETVSVLDRLVAEIFTEDGTYGDAGEATVINGNAIITAADVTLVNMHIKGNLLIAESVGDGTVVLDNVVVDGELDVRGGGPASVVLENSKVVSLTVSKDGVRIVIRGSKVDEARVKSASTIEQDPDAEGIEVLIIEEIPAEGEVVLLGDYGNLTVKAVAGKIVVESGHVDEVVVDETATDVELVLGSEASVSNLVLNAPATVTGSGKIEKATVNASGAVIEPEPEEVELGEGVSAIIGGVVYVPEEEPKAPPKPPVVPVRAISVEGVAKVGETLTAKVTPPEATVTYQWQKADAADGTFENISGATDSTYTLTNEDADKYIRVVVTGTGSYTGTKTSAAVGPVSQLPVPDQTLAEAKTAVEGVLGEFTASNDTTEAELLAAIKAVVTNDEITVTIEDFAKTDATTEAVGSITGKVKLTLGEETVEVEINLTIDKLPEADPDAAKAAFLAALEEKVAEIDVADVEIVGENITVSFYKNAAPADVLTAAEGLLAAFQEELEDATLIFNNDEDEGKFELKDENVAIDIAVYLLGEMNPADFLAGEETVEATYTAEATDKNDVTFTLAGTLKFQVKADPDAAKAAFLAVLEEKVAEIDVADVEIVGENITVSFYKNAAPADVLTAAEGLLAAFQEELEDATLIFNNDEDEGKFELKDENVAIDIAVYLLGEMNPADFLAGEETVEATYTAEATDKNDVTFTLAGTLKFQVKADPDAAKAAFLAALEEKVAEIDVADVEIVGENITVSFYKNAAPADVLTAAEGLLAAFQEELEDATLIFNNDEDEGKFELKDENVAIDIAVYLLGEMNPADFLAGEETVEATYTAEATDKNDVTFTLAGTLKFQVKADPDAAKAAFLAALEEKVAEIDVADVEIVGENITVSFYKNAAPADVLTAAEGLLAAFQEELEDATLIFNNDEDEGKFELKDENVAIDIAVYLLGEMNPADFLAGEETVEATYTAEATDKNDVTFTLAGTLKFQVKADPDAAKAAFLAALEEKVAEIDVADVEIVGENITVSFYKNAAPADVLTAAEGLLAAFQEELEDATLIFNNDEDEGKFELKDENVAIDIAVYLLGEMNPADFLAGEETVEATYTAEATDKNDVTFTLAGTLKFQVKADPDAAKAAFLAVLEEKVAEIDVADVEIVGENITVSFYKNAAPADVLTAAEGLLAAFQEELEDATLIFNNDEDEGKFELKDENVAIDIAVYLLGEMNPADFLAGEETVEATYTAEATDKNDVTFTLAGTLKFQVKADPDAAKAAFLAVLEEKVAEIDVADVEIVGENITVSFYKNAAPADVLTAAEGLLAAFQEELEDATLIFNNDEDEGKFELKDENVAIDIAVYLLGEMNPADFLAGEETVEATYTAEATDKNDVTFTLAGTLKFQVKADPDAAKAAFLAVLEEKVAEIDVADVEIVGENITVVFTKMLLG